MKINQIGDRKLECNVNQDTKNNRKKKQTQKYILKKIPYSFLNFDTTHIKKKATNNIYDQAWLETPKETK